MKYSSWPGIPVRATTCAANNERTVGRRTQHHVITRNDVLTRCIDIIDCEAFGNPSHLVSSRPSQFSADNGACKAEAGGVVIVRTRFCRRFWPLLDPGQGARQLVEPADGGSDDHAGGPGIAESPLPPPLTQGLGLWQTKRQRARVSNLSSLGYDLSVGGHAMIRV